MKLKVCGLRDNVMEVAGLQPDYAGFIFYPKSPRYVGENMEIPQLPVGVKKVGVFVNEPAEKVLEISRSQKLDFVQLHGSESPAYCDGFRQAGLGVIKVIPVEASEDFRKVDQYADVVDYFLFDTKSEKHGGTGRQFNWSLLKNYTLNIPYFLSGGISLENMKELSPLNLENLHAIDVNSAFEVRPGLKNMETLVRLCELLTEINRQA